MKTFLVRIGERAQALWYLLRALLGAQADVSQITDQLWCGGAISTVRQVEQLARDGITADIDCRDEFNEQSLIAGFNRLPSASDALKQHPQIAYCYDGVPDDGQPKPVSWFATAWDFAKPLLDSGGVVLAHCAAGVNRGPSIAYFLLRAQSHVEPDAAFALLTQKRPKARVAYRADADRALQELGL